LRILFSASCPSSWVLWPSWIISWRWVSFVCVPPVRPLLLRPANRSSVVAPSLREYSKFFYSWLSLFSNSFNWDLWASIPDFPEYSSILNEYVFRRFLVPFSFFCTFPIYCCLSAPLSFEISAIRSSASLICFLTISEVYSRSAMGCD
jgi:hypothetical protein